MKPRLFKTFDGASAFVSSRRGCALHIEILHDDGCTVNRCVCRPWYRVSELTADGWIAAEREQTRWIAEGLN